MCKHCSDSTSFSRWDAKDRFILAFEKIRDIKFGALVSCPGCGAVFAKTEAAENPGWVELNRVDKAEMPAVEAWENEILEPTTQQLEVLRAIGATPPDLYTNGSGHIVFPCRVRLKSGKELDFCLVRFQKLPPLQSNIYGAPYLLLNEVAEIFPSDFALSREVRYATTRAEEIRMSFAPTIVMGPDNRKYYLNWTNDFIDFENWKGKDVRLSGDDGYQAMNIGAGPLGSGKNAITYIIGDWKDDYLKLRITG